MASAVANRHDVAALVLAAAGDGARAMVQGVNKYRQTAVHIAARRDECLPLLRLLLGACGEYAHDEVRRADANGDMPVDVAVKHGAFALEHFLRHV
jgi:hypothetical protein